MVRRFPGSQCVLHSHHRITLWGVKCPPRMNPSTKWLGPGASQRDYLRAASTVVGNLEAAIE